MPSPKNKKIYGIVIESKAVKSALRKLSELADNLGITVRYIQYSMDKIAKPTVTAIAFLDFSNAEVPPEEALKLVKNYDFVEDARLIDSSSNGIIYDNYFFPLVINGDQRVVIFRKSVYEALFNGVRRRFGSAGDAMLYYQGFVVGYGVYDEYVKTAGSINLEDLIDVVKATNMTLGWGIIDKVKIDLKKGMAQLRVYHSFECEMGKNQGKTYSQFYRGVIAGFCTRFFGKKVKANETKCIAKGDPYCEFTVKT